MIWPFSRWFGAAHRLSEREKTQQAFIDSLIKKTQAGAVTWVPRNVVRGQYDAAINNGTGQPVALAGLQRDMENGAVVLSVSDNTAEGHNLVVFRQDSDEIPQKLRHNLAGLYSVASKEDTFLSSIT